MKIAIWKTGHTIADTVADAIMKGLPNALLHFTNEIGSSQQKDVYAGTSGYGCVCCCADIHIGYGILRGTSEVFRLAERCKRTPAPRWIHLDRGYFSPNHFGGYYRVSLRGTQQTSGWPEPDYERLERLKLDIKPWRGFDHSKPVLVCPPTEAVRDFFDVNPGWIGQSLYDAGGSIWKLRNKGDTSPFDFNDYNYVLTFNSSVGWQALQAGIPCVSDPKHSIVGTWFADAKLTETLSEKQESERMKLFGVMSALQLTLEEIRAGRLWELLQNLLISSLVETVENPSAPASLSIPSASAPTLQSRFTTSGIVS